ncbi:MAG: AAA family ATPase [Ruminococcaceae bacterium]|nr:AAA family ATPase [Oscillospiraceae bacterium]
MRCGLLGEKLGHSYSPQIHSYLGNYSYSLFEKKPEELDDFFHSGDFDCINVTIPYKKDVIPYCSELTECAKKLGSVNTIVRKADGSLIGHNTDFFGFRSMLLRMELDVAGKKALVLGSGGASVTAVAVLKELGANVVVISRSGENNYSNLSLHKDASVIVNATPVGMYPNAGVSPVDLDLFPKLEGVLDIVYNPDRTRLILDAEGRNIPAQNGLWMLVAQAKESAEWFTSQKISDEVIGQIYNSLQKQMENIVLVGMPGCGKSTIGKQLAKALNKQFVDADAEITLDAQMNIPEIFAKFGEDGFRRIETQVLNKIGQMSNLVIATGGGCVTREENYPLLHQNGTICWIKRDIDALPKAGRPLSQAGNLAQMYAYRKPLYAQFADITVENSGTVAEVVQNIVKGLGK